ncbi:MAG: PIN domain-containing protein [Candidatus Bathyarchaeia archaeon]|jgi:predicted nucleic acid-binding protein
MSEQIVSDAYAWVEYLDGTKRGEKLRDLLEGGAEIYTSAVTVAEVVSRAARTKRGPETARAIIGGNSTVVEADEQLSYDAGMMHAEVRQTIRDFGLADAYVLATARKLGARVLTGDPHFKDIGDAIMI